MKIWVLGLSNSKDLEVSLIDFTSCFSSLQTPDDGLGLEESEMKLLSLAG